MSDLSDYEDAARWLCEKRDVDPDDLNVQYDEHNPREYGSLRWELVAIELQNHDMMNAALAHGREAKQKKASDEAASKDKAEREALLPWRKIDERPYYKGNISLKIGDVETTGRTKSIGLSMKWDVDGFDNLFSLDDALAQKWLWKEIE